MDDKGREGGDGEKCRGVGKGLNGYCRRMDGMTAGRGQGSFLLGTGFRWVIHIVGLVWW